MLRQSEVANHTSAKPFTDEKIASANISSSKSVSPRLPSVQWEGTCIAAVGSEPASSWLPPVPSPSSASPPGPQ